MRSRRPRRLMWANVALCGALCLAALPFEAHLTNGHLVALSVYSLASGLWMVRATGTASEIANDNPAAARLVALLWRWFGRACAAVGAIVAAAVALGWAP